MNKSTIFLLGMLSGMGLLIPSVVWLYRTPKIIAEPVSEVSYISTKTTHFFIKNIPSFYRRSKFKNLRIELRSLDLLNVEAKKRHVTYGVDLVAGFYDPTTNEIWCVDSVPVLIHELKHVFEGIFHR